MSKYIINNCPARLPKSGLCIEAPKKKAYSCQNCNNCIIKQIYDLCNKYKEYDIIALQITKLLDVQEVE